MDGFVSRKRDAEKAQLEEDLPAHVGSMMLHRRGLKIAVEKAQLLGVVVPDAAYRELDIAGVQYRRLPTIGDQDQEELPDADSRLRNDSARHRAFPNQRAPISARNATSQAPPKKTSSGYKIKLNFNDQTHRSSTSAPPALQPQQAQTSSPPEVYTADDIVLPSSTNRLTLLNWYFKQCAIIVWCELLGMYVELWCPFCPNGGAICGREGVFFRGYDGLWAHIRQIHRIDLVPNGIHTIITVPDHENTVVRSYCYREVYTEAELRAYVKAGIPKLPCKIKKRRPGQAVLPRDHNHLVARAIPGVALAQQTITHQETRGAGPSHGYSTRSKPTDALQATAPTTQASPMSGLTLPNRSRAITEEDDVGGGSSGVELRQMTQAPTTGSIDPTDAYKLALSLAAISPSVPNIIKLSALSGHATTSQTDTESALTTTSYTVNINGVNTTIEYLSKCSVVVRIDDDDRWYLMACPVCGMNVNTNDEYLNHLSTLLNHISHKHKSHWKAHKGAEKKEELIVSCFEAEVSEEMVWGIEDGTHIVVPRR